MSRIHDALKRAEQERATSMGTHVEPAYNQPEAPRENMPSLQPLQPLMATPPTMVSGLNYESLVSHCPQTEWSPDPRTMLFFQEDDSRVGAEEFRTLRNRLYQIREKMSLKRLMVTSALPKEGKSFVAANLAQVMVRQHGRRALVIDADLRNPGMHRHLGAAQSPTPDLPARQRQCDCRAGNLQRRRPPDAPRRAGQPGGSDASRPAGPGGGKDEDEA